MARTVGQRLWTKVVPNEHGCLIWQGGTAKGYGKIWFDGKLWSAHRLAYRLTYGDIPEEIEVCHNCPGGDNPACCNPEHLFLGSHLDNLKDASRKGRMRGPGGKTVGEKNGRAKLTFVQVDTIRKEYHPGKTKQADLAAKYGVNQTMISAIIRGVNWKSKDNNGETAQEHQNTSS